MITINTKFKDAVYYIDDKRTHTGDHMMSGWDYDGRGDGKNSPLKNGGWRLYKVNDDGPVLAKRDITAICGGKATHEALLNLDEGNGFYLLWATNEKIAVKLLYNNETFYIENQQIAKVKYGQHHIKLDFDFDKYIFGIQIDKKFCGTYNFIEKTSQISKFVCGFELGSFGAATLYFNKLYANYLVNDCCISQIEGEVPDGYETFENNSKIILKKAVQDDKFTVYMFDGKENSSAIFKKNFDKSSGIVAFEVKYRLPCENSKISILLNGDAKEFEVFDEGEKLVCSETVQRIHSFNVWQTLRIEADTCKKTALVKLNGKKVGVCDFENSFLDSFEIKFAGNNAEIFFSDIMAWIIPPEPLDYVPEPIPAKKKGDYCVGMNICSLWRTGEHHGWDCVTPFDEVKPLLGYYDEGLPEVADWELKWMCEHGIDFELYCWYSSDGDAPIMRTGLSSAMHGGHFHAKYSDKVQIALLWEAMWGYPPKDMDCFKKYFVPYWIDYFFSDPRYARVDNKAIMSVFGAGNLEKFFGGVEGVHEAFDYLRQEVKKLGYDDLIIMACSGATEKMRDCGFDAVHAYNWGKSGYEMQYTKNCIQSNMDKKIMHVVPTVSSGFNNVGWAGTRSKNMSCDDLRDTLKWFRTEILPQYDKNSWKSKLCMLSTWNEYGEGTYIMPSGLNEFGYLDSIRDAFCEKVDHIDVKPTEKQKDRLCYMHPKDRAILARFDNIEMPIENDEVLKKWTFKNKEDLEKWNIVNVNPENIKIENDCLKVVSNKFDPMLILREKLEIFASKISHIRINMLGQNTAKGADLTYLYFTKKDSVDFSEEKGISKTSHFEKTSPLVFPVMTFTAWNNVIERLRIDPINGEGYFEIESIELIKAPDHKTIFIDDKEILFGMYPISHDKDIYIPADPKTEIFRALNAYYEWIKSEKTLYIAINGKELLFTVGKDSVIIDNKAEKLPIAIYEIDGIPMISLNTLLKAAEYKTEVTNNMIKIVTEK